MRFLSFAAFTLVCTTALHASDTRQLGAHEHGVGQLNIAVDGEQVAMEFHAPGADIVGFEYVASSNADRSAIADGVAALARPLDLFVLSAEAGCNVVRAAAELEADETHDHGHDAHDHDTHNHDEHDHDEHAHDAHADEDSHAEFHAEYLLECASPDALSTVEFAYFDRFENAREVDVQILSDAGAIRFKVTRSEPVLDLRGMF
jgi:hypothetical protein